MNTNWVLFSHSVQTGGAHPYLNGTQIAPFTALFLTGVQGGGTVIDGWVNYVSVVRAESHYPSVVLWFSTGFLYLNPKLTFLNRFKKPPSVNSQTHETHVFAHVSFFWTRAQPDSPLPQPGRGTPNGKTHILTYVALLVREIYFVFII